MNRQIKFRGKRRDNNEWVYGFYLHVPDGSEGDKSHQDIICTLTRLAYSELDSEEWDFAVFPESVGQYIGINDVTGKEIYENDFMSDNHSMIVPYLIIHGKYGWCMKLKTKYSEDENDMILPLINNLVSRLHVIGNLTDNPELNDLKL